LTILKKYLSSYGAVQNLLKEEGMITTRKNEDGTFSIPELEAWRLANRVGTFQTAPKMRMYRFVQDDNGCWICASHLSATKEGYTFLKYYLGGEPKQLILTNLLFMLSEGKAIPAGMETCHLCDHPACCNPGHFRLGTYSDNIRDRVARNRESYQGWNPRMDVEQIMFIRNNPTLPMRDIARAIGRHESAVGHVRRGEAYRNHAYEPTGEKIGLLTKRVELPAEYCYGADKSMAWNSKLNKPGPAQGSKCRTTGYSAKNNKK
jgi:hypothetical protein